MGAPKQPTTKCPICRSVVTMEQVTLPDKKTVIWDCPDRHASNGLMTTHEYPTPQKKDE